jgi:hypothetical protein
MNGNPLACDGGDGWRALDETHIELTGGACAEFLGNPAASVNASWPCGVVVQ